MAVLYLGSRRLPGMVERLADLSAARELGTWDRDHRAKQHAGLFAGAAC